MTTEPADFIRANTAPATPPLAPEITLYLAGEITPIWQATEATLEKAGLPPPFWAFCWPGGQVLARYLLDNPETVRGKTVLDFAAGGGVAAIAAVMAGAARVTASEIDPYAIAAMKLNAALNDVSFETTEADLTADTDTGWDMILAGDVCYERPMSDRVMAWLRTHAARGATVLMADPGRNFLPDHGLDELASYDVPTTKELEDRETRVTVLWQVRGE